VSDGDITALLDRLVGDLGDEIGNWDDVLERSNRSIRTAEPRRIQRRGPLLFGIAVVVTALVLLTVASPWRGGPSILERAAAAITSPTSGQILYESIVIHPSSPRAGAPVVHVRVWLSGASHGRFRMTMDGSQPVDLGGTVGSAEGLSYAFSDHVLDPVAFQFPVSQAVLDPAAWIKKALTSGRAQVDGKTTVRGHDVVRIRVSARLYDRLEPIALDFVDAHTYRPVRIAITSNVGRARLAFPLTSITFLPYGRYGPGRAEPRYDFEAYRHLPATAGNRKLTNVRAQHPHARIV